MKKERYFQWLDGEMQGEVSVLESISELDGETFYNFVDGESCNLRFISRMTNNAGDLRGKFVVEVESPTNLWTFETIEARKWKDETTGEVSEIPTLHDFVTSDAGGGSQSANVMNSDLGGTKLIPPRIKQSNRPLPTMDEYREAIPEPTKNEHVASFVQEKPVEAVVSVPEERVEQSVIGEKITPPETKKRVNPLDPVAILVDTCKKHSTEIPLTLEIDLPMKTLYHISDREFENGGDKFIDYIVDGLDTKIIIDALKVALKKAYCASDAE